MTGRLAFTIHLLILGYQITYAQHLEKSKFGEFAIGYSNCRSFSQQKRPAISIFVLPQCFTGKILKMVVMNAGGNE